MEPLFKVFIPEGINEELEKVLYSGRLTSGNYVSLFENKLSDFVGINVLAYNSYNSAASIPWEIIDLKEGDEVIASPMSCLASNQPVAVKRGVMKWTDIDPFVGSLSPDCVRKNITSKTKAILHYHWGGYPGYIDEIVAIGNEYGIPVIEDAIESFGAEYKGKRIGNTGADFTLFSFQPVRLPTSIDGGGLVCKDPKHHEKALLLRDYGIDRSKFRDSLGEISEKCDISIPGFGSAMSEINGLIGLRSFEQTPVNLALQREQALKNHELIKSFDKTFPIGLDGTLPNYWIYTFLSENRDVLLETIRKEHKLYASKVHLRNDFYSVFGKFEAQLKGVDKFNNESLSIPCGWWMK
jgi:dTDP-4-amino-4,6-dideoxygalactose transaminase